MFETLFWLLVSHAVCDFGLQSEWMARARDRHSTTIKVVSGRPDLIWIHILSAHAAIHAGGVALATGQVWLGVAEFVAHWLIDFFKCEQWFGFHADQLLHIASKFVWLGLLMAL